MSTMVLAGRRMCRSLSRSWTTRYRMVYIRGSITCRMTGPISAPSVVITSDCQTSLEPVSYSVCSGSRGMTRALGGLDRTRFFTVHAPSMDESRPNRPLHNKPFRAASTGLGSTDQLAREAPRLSFYHADIDGLADELLASRKNDQLVLARTPREFAGIFVAYALDQHLNGAPHPFLVLFAADPILH